MTPGSRDDTEANRDQILDAAAKVFAEKGYSGARMDDVVAEAGLSKGTVYWHYKSKDGLLTAVMRRLLAVELRKLDRLTLEQGSVADGLLAFVREFTQDLQRIAGLMPLALDFYAMARRKEWVRRFLQEYFIEYRTVLCAIVQSGIDRGEFRAVPLDETAVVLTALIEGMILLWVVDSGTVQIGPHTEAAFRLMLDGLRAGPAAAADHKGAEI